jgi:hypothetical protein
MISGSSWTDTESLPSDETLKQGRNRDHGVILTHPLYTKYLIVSSEYSIDRLDIGILFVIDTDH